MLKKSLLASCLFAVSLFSFTACSDDEKDPQPVAPAAPVVANATDITAAGFKITWPAVTKADKYLVDVSKEADFDPTVAGYNKKEVTATTLVLAGLEANTKYFFRVYAKDGNLVSAASATKDATTLQ